jgi:hypothetical protein
MGPAFVSGAEILKEPDSLLKRSLNQNHYLVIDTALR